MTGSEMPFPGGNQCVCVWVNVCTLLNCPRQMVLLMEAKLMFSAQIEPCKAPLHDCSDAMETGFKLKHLPDLLNNSYVIRQF